MSFQFPIGACVDGNSIFQQIEDHFADSIDLIGIRMLQHLSSPVSIGFFQDAIQEGTLST